MTDLASAQATLDAYSQAIKAVVGAVAPSVVRVQSGHNKQHRHGHHRKWHPGRARTNHGSGFIIDAETGHIVTNFHVVRHARQVQVHLHDGNAYTGQVIGADPDIDLAVVRIDAENLTAGTWGDSSALEVGSVVLALGNPDGDSVVATSGIVSVLNRRLRGPSGRLLENLIQTDTIFNPGMSGGPLANSAGQIVGVNTASLIEAQGINLAISSATVQQFVEDLVKYGEIRRPRLGIAGERQRIYGGLIRHHKLDQTHGVFIHEVQPDSPAKQGGIIGGDILIAAGGTVIEGLDDLHRLLGSKKAGDTISMMLLRDLDIVEVTVTLAASEGDPD